MVFKSYVKKKYCVFGPRFAASTKLMCIFQLDNNKHAKRSHPYKETQACFNSELPLRTSVPSIISHFQKYLLVEFPVSHCNEPNPQPESAAVGSVTAIYEKRPGEKRKTEPRRRQKQVTTSKEDVTGLAYVTRQCMSLVVLCP